MQVRINFLNDNGYAISHSDLDLSEVERDDWQTAIVRHVNAAHPLGLGAAGRYRVEWPKLPLSTEHCPHCGWNQRYGAHAALCVTKRTHATDGVV